jgi:hypothetical protein
MRREFLQGCKGWRKASKQCPWAACIIRVDGGFMAFESKYDFRIWEKQK